LNRVPNRIWIYDAVRHEGAMRPCGDETAPLHRRSEGL